MNKSELIAKVAEEKSMTRKDAEAVVNSVFAAVTDALKAGDKVQLAGFGSFEVKERAARSARNPQTGEAIEIEASKAVTFKPAKALKDTVNE